MSDRISININRATNYPEWGNIQNKPSSYTPSAHTHAQTEITGLEATLENKVETSDFQPVTKTSDMTQAVGKGTDGRLWTVPSGGAVSAVSSVNGYTGAVVLNASDVGVYPSNWAAAYSASSTYAVGDYCLYGGQLYRCITAITTAEAWTAYHWEHASIGEGISGLNTLTDNMGEMASTINLVNPEKIEPGVYVSGTSLIRNSSATYKVIVVDVEEGENYTILSGNYRQVATDWLGRFVVFADGNMQGMGTVLESTMHFTVPEGAKYAVVTLYTVNENPMIIKGGSTYTTGYIEYTPYRTFKSNLKTETITDLTQTRKNLYNPDKAVVGCLDAGLVNTSLTNYKTTEYIPVEANTTYVISPRARKYCLYDENKYCIVSESSEASTPIIITTTQGGYLRASLYLADITDAKPIQIEKGSAVTTYEAYGKEFALPIHLNETQIADVGFSNDSLCGKKWAVCGDSFTSGATSTVLPSGKYMGESKVYPYIIGNRTGIEVLSFFGGGKTLAYPTDGTVTNSLTNPSATTYYQNIPSDVDYITIYLGINDYGHSSAETGKIELGTIDDTTTATYYGAYNVVMTWLLENRPFAHIGIIVSNGIGVEAWVTAQINIAKKYGVPYINLNGDQHTPTMIRSYNPNMPSSIHNIIWGKQRVSESNTHPNDYAHAFESTFIEDWLRRL